MNYKEKIEYIRKQEAEKKAQAEALAKKESKKLLVKEKRVQTHTKTK